ncbi:conjugal transfer protein [Streptomyces erythrochromogenes]|uniref:conjugal transfer protein n=1 Tax=Streptomyces erythrochromogenes TaxID=285574 RepID=UPI00369FD246
MSTFKKIVWKVLNLPDPKPKPRPQDAPSAAAPASDGEAPAAVPAAQVPAGAQAWVAAGKRVQSDRTAPVSVEEPPRSQSAPKRRSAETGQQAAPWRVEEENSGTKALVKLGRVTLWIVVGLAVVTGVRSWFWPNQAPATVAPQVKAAPPAYPVQQAQAVAGRFAFSYLTWDEANPQARNQALARDMPQGQDTAQGWNAKGKQDVVTVVPGAVTELGDSRSRVHIDVLVNAPAVPAKDQQPAKPAEQRWVGLEVPVLITSDRAVVTGAPGIVGVPTSGPALPAQKAKNSDAPMSDQTKSVVSGFFTEYAKGEADGVMAPGAVIPPLPAGMTLGTVQSWTVDEGSGDKRTGTAVVVWKIGPTELEQSYRVDITRVVAASAERWQVADVHGGTS